LVLAFSLGVSIFSFLSSVEAKHFWLLLLYPQSS
jgi:hypothetical protein